MPANSRACNPHPMREFANLKGVTGCYDYLVSTVLQFSDYRPKKRNVRGVIQGDPNGRH
jgi:hypothetical protein